MKRILHFLIPLLILSTPVAVRYLAPETLQSLQLQVFDKFFISHPRVASTEYPVVIVDVDDASLAQYGQWPWPRNVISQIIDKLKEYGASSVGFDMVFAEADRSSPSRISEALGDSAKHLDPIALAVLPNYDDMLAQSITKAHVVLGYSLSDNAGKALPLVKYGMASKGTDPIKYAINHPYAVLNIPELERAAEGNGSFNVQPDKDGVIRRIPLLFAMKDTLLPSLSLELLRVAQNASTYMTESVNQDSTITDSMGFASVHVGELDIPLQEDATLWLHLSPFDKNRYVSARSLLEGSVSPDIIKDRIILIGTSAIGLKDMRTTALIPTINGVEVHAQAIEQILQQDFLSRPSWMQDIELLIMLLVGIGLLALLPRVPVLIGGGVTFIFLWLASYTAEYLFTEHKWLVDPITPSIAIFLVFLFETLRRYASTEKEKKNIRNAFSHYMSPELVKQLSANPKALKLGGEMREMTIMFCDIRGFTTISEQFDAEGLTTFINRFLTPMTSAILWRQGTIDKYIGDCIMAFWNAPLSDELHTTHACEAALDMLEALEKLNATLYEESLQNNTRFIPVHIGIGINTGTCCVGNMGSTQRFDYSVLGDDVNLASRLEGQSKNYGVPIVLGQNTAVHVQEMAILEIDLIQVKGKTEAVQIYTLFGGRELSSTKEFKAFREAFDAMRTDYQMQDWYNALHNLKDAEVKANIALEGKAPSELFTLYRERIEQFRDAPLEGEWSPVYVAKSK